MENCLFGAEFFSINWSMSSLHVMESEGFIFVSQVLLLDTFLEPLVSVPHFSVLICLFNVNFNTVLVSALRFSKVILLI